MSPHAPTAPSADAKSVRLPHGSGARRWAIVGMIMLLMIIIFADKTVYGLAGKSLMSDLGLTQSQFGLGGSIFLLLFGVSAVAVGFVGNKASSTKVLLILALAWSLSLGPLLLAPAFATLLVSRLMLGAAEGPTMPVAIHGVHKWFPESKRAMPLALVTLVGMLGFSWLSARLVQRGVSTRWARGFMTGAVVVVAGVLILLGLQADGTMAAVLLLVGFGLTNATNPVGMLTVSEISPVKQRSAILAVWQSLVTLGGVVASIGVGVLADHAIDAGGTAVDGYELAFAIAAIAAVAGGLICAWRTNAHRDAVRLGLQKSESIKV